METNNEDVDRLPEIFAEMNLLNEHKLPRACGNCGKTFEGLDHFLEETDPLPEAASLLQEAGYENLPFFDLWRQCSCGTTLLVVCPERRERSAEGRHQRQAFDKLSERLTQVGFTDEEARNYLQQLFLG